MPLLPVVTKARIAAAESSTVPAGQNSISAPDRRRPGDTRVRPGLAGAGLAARQVQESPLSPPPGPPIMLSRPDAGET
jgi:hypothetical protein